MDMSTGTLVYESKESILSNGETVVLKLLTRSDEAQLRDFFAQIPPHEVETLRDDVHDPAIISRWVTTMDYRYVIPLVAWNESEEHMVSVSSLHRMRGVYRHIADVRIVVGPTHRKLGLGSVMIKELIEIGTRQGLHFLRAEILLENQLAIKSFRQLGFEYKCTLEGCFMTLKERVPRDVALMLKRLQIDLEEDFFYVF